MVNKSMQSRRASAKPTKAFFVRMLTRDISLDDCILDLIDNSIDSAWRKSGAVPSGLSVGTALSKFVIDIRFDEDHFYIRDNCGGISLDDAVSYAFTFGRVEPDAEGGDQGGEVSADEQGPSAVADGVEGDDEANERADGQSDFSVGIYGIGMKRAVFKLGNDVQIRSTYTDGSSSESFKVPISVKEWLRDHTEPWDFDLEEDVPLVSPGVEITVRDLTEESMRAFGDPVYERTLIDDVLARDYLIPLMQGLVINVNGRPVAVKPVELRSSDEFSPLREVYDDGGVRVEIVAGMSAPPPDDNEPQASREDRDSGWYVVCNGRVVLAADRSEATGWGAKDFPRWHGQYSGFVGMVLFTAADPSLLPMTTTKRSISASSTVYQRALNRMIIPARTWIDYTNRRKASLEEAKAAEARAKSVPAWSLPMSGSVGLPKVAKPKPVANVNYSVPKVKMLALAKALGDGTMSYRDVGISSFDYSFDALVDDEE